CPTRRSCSASGRGSSNARRRSAWCSGLPRRRTEDRRTRARRCRMRAIEPTHSGYATNPHDGVRSFYEVFGPVDARRTLVMVPSWPLVHSRVWKMQVPFFARHGMRVVIFDGRGNGASDTPDHGYAAEDFGRDTVAVMDAAGVERAVLVGVSAIGRASGTGRGRPPSGRGSC